VRRILQLAIGAALAAGGPLTNPVMAQLATPPPDLQNRIPAPLPPPPQPPAINGPLSQSPPQGTYNPPRLKTHGDRTRNCIQQGSGAGLRGADLDAYTRSCANAN
jgi:hypothetical protein